MTREETYLPRGENNPIPPDPWAHLTPQVRGELSAVLRGVPQITLEGSVPVIDPQGRRGREELRDLFAPWEFSPSAQAE